MAQVINCRGGRTGCEGRYLLSGHFSANRNQHWEANCARNKFPTRSDLQGSAGAPWFGGSCDRRVTGTANAGVLTDVAEASTGSHVNFHRFWLIM